MSVDPALAIGSAANSPAVDPVSHHDSSLSERASTARSELGTKPRAEHLVAKLASESTEMPRDEVQVQRVNGASGDIVIRYLDASGNLILQIPSSQLLGLAKAIDQALEAQANQKVAGSETVPGQEGAFHGR